ncbi:hypothetical protein HAPAU_25800 [Halalkalicoccus paucihalophilus]|uniref:MBL fold metallo-hydrolase n=1 Tax=Halalkalicoccus paucihalophilus TaxID=1008153 RepID=A0A151AED2_9EURY|nr:hypothetical protein HAPAU_25800 [Halalkalicoccus paucihalophilus]
MTHWHSDHAGLACRLVEAAGATIHLHSADAPLVGEMRGIHAKFGAGEAAAHLNQLAALDVVERTGEDPLSYRPRVADYPSDLNLTP